MLNTFEDLQLQLKEFEALNHNVGPCVLCGQKTYSRCTRCKKHFCEDHTNGKKECATPRDAYANRITDR